LHLYLQDPSPIKKKGVRETLASEEGAAAARLSHRLVALQTDVDVPVVRCRTHVLCCLRGTVWLLCTVRQHAPWSTCIFLLRLSSSVMHAA
jgi:hypothetical protein